jgi:hypothetical protein
VEVNVFQSLEIDGLSEPTLTEKYQAALRNAYESLGVNASQVTFGDATIYASRRRRLDRGPFTMFQRRLERMNDFVIPVTIQTTPVQTSSIATGLRSSLFVENITQELESYGEGALMIQETDVVGMEVLFSIKAETILQIESSIINNNNFAQEVTDQAIINGAISSLSTATTDKSLIRFVTFAPTVSPTAVPTEDPTTVPSGSPTNSPAEMPSETPTASHRPTYTPSATPSLMVPPVESHHHCGSNDASKWNLLGYAFAYFCGFASLPFAKGWLVVPGGGGVTIQTCLLSSWRYSCRSLSFMTIPTHDHFIQS